MREPGRQQLISPLLDWLQLLAKHFRFLFARLALYQPISELQTPNPYENFEQPLEIVDDSGRFAICRRSAGASCTGWRRIAVRSAGTDHGKFLHERHRRT